MTENETVKEYKKGSAISDLVQSEGWGEVKDKLVERMLSIQSIDTIEATDPTAVLLEIKARKLAVEIVYGWLREVFGASEQFQGNRESMEPYIRRT